MTVFQNAVFVDDADHVSRCVLWQFQTCSFAHLAQFEFTDGNDQLTKERLLDKIQMRIVGQRTQREEGSIQLLAQQFVGTLRIDQRLRQDLLVLVLQEQKGAIVDGPMGEKNNDLPVEIEWT